jgi:acetaldehyde dehydrogenase/alcohol dehydrogenase
VTSATDPAIAHAHMMLQRGRWASRAFARYAPDRVAAIVEAVAAAGYAQAGRYAEWAVQETGMGVVEHKRRKNELCSVGIAEAYRDHDFASARIDAESGIVELPRPAGVVLALTPSTNPVSTLFFKVLIALMTRNAIVVSPHPLARACSVDAARLLADAAVRAGAPDGAVQVVEHPSIPLIEALMSDELTDVIVATGGSAVVRAAYRSGNPAIGVGPGNVPVFVDASADLEAAASLLVASKSFDNSVLCTNESTLIVEAPAAERLSRELQLQGAHVCSEEEADLLRRGLFRDGHFRPDLVGRDAPTLAREAGMRVDERTRILVAPFPLVVPEEPLCSEKLFPCLGMVSVPDVQHGIAAARAVVRHSGAGHSAVIHSQRPATVMAYAAAVDVLRVAVNVGGSTGSAGFDTRLAPTMTIGTGFFGRSSVGENLAPKHLVNWTRIAYPSGLERVPDFSGLQPYASELPAAAPEPADSAAVAHDLREQVRALIIDELRDLVAR